MGIQEVDPITLLCAGIANKDPFKSARGEFRERMDDVADESSTSKDMRRE